MRVVTRQVISDSAQARLAGGRTLLARTSTAERVAEVVRETITDGTFPPGARLSEPDICAALGVSRNTLREAFRYLAKDRLVTHELNRGVFVRVPTLDDIAELYRCRRFVECAAIRGFDGNREALDMVYEALEVAAERRAAGDWTAVGTADIRFHRALTSLAGSERIDELMEATWAELRLVFLAMGDPRPFHEPYIERNQALVDNLAQGNVAVAEQALFGYLVDAERQISAAYQERMALSGS
ncbi:GntR family transcriptional regulator [Nocardia rhamnosiphila]